MSEHRYTMLSCPEQSIFEIAPGVRVVVEGDVITVSPAEAEGDRGRGPASPEGGVGVLVRALARLAEIHACSDLAGTRQVRQVCVECSKPWPCPTRMVLDRTSTRCPGLRLPPWRW